MNDDLYAELFSEEGQHEIPTKAPLAPQAPQQPAPSLVAVTPTVTRPVTSREKDDRSGAESPLEYYESSDEDDFTIILKQDTVARAIQRAEEGSYVHSREVHDHSASMTPITSIPVRVISNKGGDEVAWTRGKELIANALAAPIPDEYTPPKAPHPQSHKTIYDFDIDQDPEKAWRNPGADVSDYFNYGFTEETWRLYCQRQANFRVSQTLPRARPQPTMERIQVYQQPQSDDVDLPPGQSPSFPSRPSYGMGRRRR
ncbi:hypothetical protein GEMRC1_005307 [Eukaryota sp. GEM-RC1]